jgi:hypothetical protein
MLTIGTVMAWRKKTDSASVCKKGVVSQWRPAPDRAELVPEIGAAYGEWVNESDIVIIEKGKKE